MIKSAIYKGLIHAGQTKLASDIQVAQTGPMQLTVKAGTFTSTDGTEFALTEDSVFDLQAHAEIPTWCRIALGLVGEQVEVWCGACLLDGMQTFSPPDGWQELTILALEFVIPPKCERLDGIDIFVLRVVPGELTAEQMLKMGVMSVGGGMRQVLRT